MEEAKNADAALLAPRQETLGRPAHLSSRAMHLIAGWLVVLLNILRLTGPLLRRHTPYFGISALITLLHIYPLLCLKA